MTKARSKRVLLLIISVPRDLSLHRSSVPSTVPGRDLRPESPSWPSRPLQPLFLFFDRPCPLRTASSAPCVLVAIPTRALPSPRVFLRRPRATRRYHGVTGFRCWPIPHCCNWPRGWLGGAKRPCSRADAKSDILGLNLAADSGIWPRDSPFRGPSTRDRRPGSRRSVVWPARRSHRVDPRRARQSGGEHGRLWRRDAPGGDARSRSPDGRAARRGDAGCIPGASGHRGCATFALADSPYRLTAWRVERARPAAFRRPSAPKVIERLSAAMRRR